ncbi:MAG: DUF1800 family protein, partial [Candidatus Sulfotelmatobacter sp.]
MRLGHGRIATSVLVFCLAYRVLPLLAKKTAPPDSSNQKRALHALNRLTFGPRPGDVQQVAAMGVDRWIELQLHPEKIDDSALNSRLEPFRTLRMSTREIAESFPDPQEINQVMNGKRPMPSDPATRAIYEVQLAKLRARKEQKEEEAKIPTASAAMVKPGEEPQASMTPARPAPQEQEQERIREEQTYANFDFEGLTILPADQRYQRILTMKPEELVSFAQSLRGGKGRDFIEGMSPQQKETLLALNNPSVVVDSELAQAKLLRAIYSQRQLEEVMTDFWFNHFNVFADKGLDRLMLTGYERDVIRPHALGRFEDLLVATAKSPAMLFYLDNWLSVGPHSAQALGVPAHGYG